MDELTLQRMKRRRLAYTIVITLTTLLGLLTRQYAHCLPEWNKLYLGDVLWAMNVFFMFGWLFPAKSSFAISIYALLFSFVIEFSQLYHAMWIDTLRATRLGGLVLGFGFLWTDLLCYSIGIAWGFIIEFYFRKSRWFFK